MNTQTKETVGFLEDLAAASLECYSKSKYGGVDIMLARIPKVVVDRPKNIEYRRLRTELDKIKSLDEEYEAITGNLRPSDRVLSKMEELIEAFQTAYQDSDECYLSPLPNGNVKLRFSKGRLSHSIYVSNDEITIIILDYIDEKHIGTYPMNTPISDLVDLMEI